MSYHKILWNLAAPGYQCRVIRSLWNSPDVSVAVSIQSRFRFDFTISYIEIPHHLKNKGLHMSGDSQEDENKCSKNKICTNWVEIIIRKLSAILLRAQCNNSVWHSHFLCRERTSSDSFATPLCVFSRRQTSRQTPDNIFLTKLNG